MKNLKQLLLATILVLSFNSCEKDETFSCATEVNKILEEFAPLLQAELPPEGLPPEVLFNWQPFYDLLEERTEAIEAIGCGETIEP